MGNKELEKGLSILQGIIDVANTTDNNAFATPHISAAKKEESKAELESGNVGLSGVSTLGGEDGQVNATDEDEQIFFDDEPVRVAKKAQKENKSVPEREDAAAKIVPPVMATLKNPTKAVTTTPVDNPAAVANKVNNSSPVINNFNNSANNQKIRSRNNQTSFSKSKFYSALIIAICAAVSLVAAWKAIPSKNMPDSVNYIPVELVIGQNDIGLWNIVRNMKGKIGSSELVFSNGIATDSVVSNLRWKVQFDFMKTRNGVMTKVQCGSKYWVVETDNRGSITRTYPAPKNLKTLKELFRE